jgi:hypothetical protein
MGAEIECVNPECSVTYNPAETGFQCPDCSTPTPEDKKPDVDDTEESSGSETEPLPDATCDSCGEEVPEDANLCPYCGHEFDDDGGVQKPEINCPKPDCSGSIPQGGNYCIQCGHERGDDVDTDEDEGEEGVTVTFDVEGQQYDVIEDGEIAVETDDELPDNSFGLQARKAAANAGIDVGEAKKIHRDHLLLDVEDGPPIVENNGVNPTKYNGESLSQGDRRELSDGDEIELTGVTTVTVRVN